LADEQLIAIVDDDRPVRVSLRRLLKSFGYSVTVFPSGVEFLTSTHLAETDCLISDVNMPSMTGVDLYQRLIKLGHAIPTILITAYADEAVRTRALNDGVVGYLQKPVDEGDLMNCLRLALDRHNSRP
jgi:FixJ family two-component response regulator